MFSTIIKSSSLSLCPRIFSFHFVGDRRKGAGARKMEGTRGRQAEGDGQADLGGTICTPQCFGTGGLISARQNHFLADTSSLCPIVKKQWIHAPKGNHI